MWISVRRNTLLVEAPGSTSTLACCSTMMLNAATRCPQVSQRFTSWQSVTKYVICIAAYCALTVAAALMGFVKMWATAKLQPAAVEGLRLAAAVQLSLRLVLKQQRCSLSGSVQTYTSLFQNMIIRFCGS